MIVGVILNSGLGFEDPDSASDRSTINGQTKHGEQETETERGKEQADKEGGEREVEPGDGDLREEVPRSTEEERDKG